MSTLNLLSIEEEAAACRARCAGMKIGDMCLHLHHEVLAESLTEPIENRISYILGHKPIREQALRLRMMGPFVIDQQMREDPEWEKADAELQKADAELQKADAERQKAYAELQKAEAAWRKAYAAWQKADAAWQKASAAWEKADAEYQKASAAWEKADAEYQKAYEPHYKRLYPESPWNGRTIFSKPNA